MKQTYISIFSSAGVGCYGFKQEDFDCVATVELLDERMSIQKANKKCKYDSGYIQGDISQDQTKQAIIEEIDYWMNNEKINEIDFVVATPPCQSMSTLNKKTSQDQKLVKNSLVVEAVDIIKKVKPKVFLFENTRTFLRTKCFDKKTGYMLIGEYIENELSEYNIVKKVINLKDYGANSSRPRTIIIGTRKNIKKLNPYFLWPEKSKPKIISQIIKDKIKLTKMDQFDTQDPLHRFRRYDKKMVHWIKNTKPGQSAFENTNPLHRPHKVVDGKIVFNQNKMTNKYKRTIPENVMPCIHTRNDSLAPQYTIHPYENRVFSIRELMQFMAIPKSFEWSRIKFKTLVKNSSDKAFVENWYRKNELNIRRTIGESVPTAVFRNIASRYKLITNQNHPMNKIIEFERNNQLQKSLNAYYTYPSTAFDLLKNLKPAKIKTILEPCSGAGLLTLSIIEWIKYHDIKPKLLLNDLDPAAIKLLKKNIQYTNSEFYNKDFMSFTKKADIIIMNPPYGPLKTKKYTNLWEAFIGHSMILANHVSTIIPKSFLNSDKISQTRLKTISKGISYIKDNGIHAFEKVYLETVSINIGNNPEKTTLIESWLYEHPKTKVTKSIVLGTMLLIYKDKTFDTFLNNLQIDVFDYYRDRQISKKDFVDTGMRVIKSKNIDKWKVIKKEGYDKFIKTKKYKIFNYKKSDCYIMPNFTYNIRVAKKPKNTVADGGVILLFPKIKNLSESRVKIINTEDYKEYYSVLMNKSRFTLNMNLEIMKYIGVQNEK